MPRINFYLKDKAASNETLIYAFVSANGKRHKISTGQKIKPRHWNDKKQKAKNSLPGQNAFNDYLSEVAVSLETTYHEILASGQPVTATLLRQAIQPPEAEAPAYVVSAIHEFIEDGERSGKAYNTLRNYKGFLNHIKSYEASTRMRLLFEDIDSAFEGKLVSYLIRECGSSQTNIAKQFSILKAFMRWAEKQKYHDNPAFMKYSQREKPSTKVALSEAELEQLATADLSNRPGLERVRDMFLFCCETSLRYSDLANLKPVNIGTAGEERFLTLSMVKTRGGIDGAILSPTASALIDRYADPNRATCFPIISGQKMNDFIKEACQLAGLNETIQTVRFIGSDRIEEATPKYKLVTMHTARRTFITTRIQWGWTDRQIMIYTGHQSSKEISTYRDKSTEANLEIARQAPRPNRPMMRKVG